MYFSLSLSLGASNARNTSTPSNGITIGGAFLTIGGITLTIG